MNVRNTLPALCLLLLFASCGDQHFITDPAVRQQVEDDFRSKQESLPDGNFFEIFGKQITTQEREALSFLYAYMPLGDVTDYSGEFYLANIRATFSAREEMPWSNNIPEEIFRHFVLPVRVNNENMDESRMIFYEELKDRVKGLSLYDAVLEVNHWCHEKVIYTPSDSRTSAPLATVRSATGRCGEESVFTVAALRSVGIPARQVYTPRWAHTDDNHAWVEAWVDGRWYFLGACEPEPVLNLAWFNEPVARGMLMHTKAFGKYNGPEEIMEQTKCYTEINVTANYAPTASVTVLVTDGEGNPMPGAAVEFKIYNYAEYYTVATKQTDDNGRASLSAGKGDMLIWATKDGKYNFGKVSFGKDTTITLPLADERPAAAVEMEIIPPVEGRIDTQVTGGQKASNALRLHREDSIRTLYVSTFYNEKQAAKLAKELNADAGEIARYMTGSRGNHRAIESFLRSASPQEMDKALALLNAVSAKDLRDAPAGVLSDHLQTAGPRVSNEMLTPYRSFFREAISATQAEEYLKDPRKLAAWVKENIRPRDKLNPQRIPVSPAGVWKSRTADSHSRNIFFVSLAKSVGIKARLEPVTGKVQYAIENNWTDVDFETTAPAATQGRLLLTYTPSGTVRDPRYYSHFTIARIQPDGRLHTLDFSSAGEGTDTWSALFGRPVAMDEGDYLLITGSRMAKGNVLSSISPFSIRKDKITRTELLMRQNPEDISVLGSLDAEATFELADNNRQTSILSTTGRGYFIIGIIGAQQEPSNHALRDISAVADKLDKWGRSMILLFPNRKGYEAFDKYEFGSLPQAITYGIDTDRKITEMILTSMHLRNADNLPLFVVADTFGRIVFVSQGYTIGIGERMMEVISKL